MDEGGSKKSSKTITKQRDKNNAIQRYGIDVGSILQSIWIRCRSVFPTPTDRKFMESELRFVLYSGFIFWIVYLFWEIIK
jgi:hypothetical protein